jgi:predicted  nucleic acid-binding Zn-ribbon protein
MSNIRSPFILALAGALASACFVPQAHYDDLSQQHAAEKQKSARLTQQLDDLGKQLSQTRSTLEKLEQRLNGSEEELAKKQASLESNTQVLAEVEHQSSVKETEKQAAERMVTQLREELTRIASHIATLSASKDQFRDERDKLQAEASALQARVKSLENESLGARQRAELMRDLAVALAEPLRSKRLQLAEQGGTINLRFLSSAVFDAKTAAVSAEGRKLLVEVSKALQPASLQVQISELAPERSVAEREGHIRQVAGELRAAGIALEQLSMRDDASRPVAPAGKKAPNEIVLRLRPGKVSAETPSG